MARLLTPRPRQETQYLASILADKYPVPRSPLKFVQSICRNGTCARGETYLDFYRVTRPWQQTLPMEVTSNTYVRGVACQVRLYGGNVWKTKHVKSRAWDEKVSVSAYVCVGRCMHIVIYASKRYLLCSEKSADQRLTSCETGNDVMFVFCCQRVPCAHEQLLCAGAAGGTHLRLRLAVHRLRRRRM